MATPHYLRRDPLCTAFSAFGAGVRFGGACEVDPVGRKTYGTAGGGAFQKAVESSSVVDRRVKGWALLALQSS